MTTQVPSDDSVVVDVPAEARSLRLLRLAAANAATDLDMDIDGVESARIAIDEMASLLLATGEWTRLVVTLHTTPGCLEAHGEVRGARGPVAEVRVDRVVDELLRTCVDQFALVEGPAFTFSIVAPTPGSPAG